MWISCWGLSVFLTLYHGICTTAGQRLTSTQFYSSVCSSTSPVSITEKEVKCLVERLSWKQWISWWWTGSSRDVCNSQTPPELLDFLWEKCLQSNPQTCMHFSSPSFSPNPWPEPFAQCRSPCQSECYRRMNQTTEIQHSSALHEGGTGSQLGDGAPLTVNYLPSKVASVAWLLKFLGFFEFVTFYFQQLETSWVSFHKPRNPKGNLK